jgi:glycosyltransferase involved in cell wall biosynthesis
MVPLLSGSGTRIKVLEALAYGIPLVTTHIGCEGFELVDGVHAFIRNEPLDFARGCARVLTDDAQCLNLSNSGRSFFVDGYSNTVIGKKIRQLALDVARLSAAP